MKRSVAAIAAIAIVSVTSVARAGAVADLAQSGVSGLGALPATSVVVAAPLVSDEPAPKGDDLAVRVAQIVAGKIGNAARAHDHTAALGAARAIAGKGGALVYVQVEIAKGEIRATLDTYPPQKNAWDRVRNPLPAPVGHAFASGRIDAEVRSFLAPIPLERARVHKARIDESDVMALACGDVDGDGGMELLVVGRARIALGKVQGGRFAPSKTIAWGDLAGRVPTPARDPLGTALITRAGAIYAGSSDRGGVGMTPSLAISATLGALLPVGVDEQLACVGVDAAAGAFGTPPYDCFRNTAMDVKADPLARVYDAFAEASIVGRDGAATRVVASRDPSGKLRVKIGVEAARAFDPVGAQLVVADLDQDGAPEIATTLDAMTDDAITVATYGAGDPKTRVRIAAPGGVRALAACPPEEGGAPALVAVVGAEVWVVR